MSTAGDRRAVLSGREGRWDGSLFCLWPQLRSKPLTSAHGVAGGSALGVGAAGLSSSGGLGWNRLWLGDRGVGRGSQGVGGIGAFGGDAGEK